MLGSVEVRLSSAEVDHLDPLTAQRRNLDGNHQSGGRLDELQTLGEIHTSPKTCRGTAYRAPTCDGICRKGQSLRLLSELLLQEFHDVPRDQTIHVAIQSSNLFDQSRSRVEVRRTRHQKNRLDLWLHAPVHQRHLKFVVEVRDRAQTTDDDVRLFLLNIIDEQAVKTIIQHAVADVGKFLAEHVDPFLRTEQETIFLWVVDDRDDDFIDDLQTTANNVDVPVGRWVERPRINCPAVHAASSP